MPRSEAYLSTVVLLLGIVALVSGCGGVSSARAIDYRNTRTLPPLDVPPDLAPTATAARPELGAGGAGSTTYSGYAGSAQSQQAGSATVLPKHPNVRLAREGQMRFIIVKAEALAVWDAVREFLNQTGLLIVRENASAGLIETNWAENRALVGASSDNSFAKWVKSFFSVGVRDKYRIRLERGVEPGTIEVYLAHSGMQELALDDKDYQGGANAGWKPRPRDPELEAEMIHRLVAFLSGNRDGDTVIAKGKAEIEAESSPTPAAPTRPPSAKLTHNGNGAALLALEDSLERAWRRVGLSLDRIGFTVEDRDRSKGIYYVRYIDPDNKAQEKGFFARLFSSDDPPPNNQYQVQIRAANDGTNVEVLDKEGVPDGSKTGERILSLLYEQLK